MTIKRRVKTLEGQRVMTEIPRGDLIKVITDMNNDEIEVLRMDLGLKYGVASKKIIFVDTGVPRGFGEQGNGVPHTR